MAARKQAFHPDEVKKKIQASQLINRLTKHALSDEPVMDASQVTAATKLLNKVLPDLKAVEMDATHSVSDPLAELLGQIAGAGKRIGS